MALVMTAAMLLSGCSGRTPAGESGSSSTQTVEPETWVAAVAVPLEQTPALVPMPEERPTLYEEGGKYGFRAADGSVLVPAEYAAGYDFSDDCLGQLRKDENGEMTWYAVGLDGTMLGDVNNTVIQTSAGPVVVLERWGDGGSRADYQLMNLNLEPLLPEWAEYLYHGDFTLPGGKLLLPAAARRGADEFLPGELALLEFEPYEESRAELYRESWDLAEEEVVVVNGRALFGADAHSWEPEDLPLPVLEQVDWTIRSGGKTRQTRISVGRDPDYDTFAFYTEGQGGANRSAL